MLLTIDNDDVILPQRVNSDSKSHVYHLFVIRVDRREGFQKFLKSRGIQTDVHYPIPPHHQEAFKEKFIYASHPGLADICRHATSHCRPLDLGLSVPWHDLTQARGARKPSAPAQFSWALALVKRALVQVNPGAS